MNGWNLRRPAPKVGNYGTGWRAVRLTILDRDGWLCRVRISPNCVVDLHARPGVATVDHILPIALGGTHDPSNLRACCKACNLLMGARLGRRRQAAALARRARRTRPTPTSRAW
jgi:5-methylcytosine-specific restriction endonuclease McrA